MHGMMLRYTKTRLVWTPYTLVFPKSVSLLAAKRGPRAFQKLNLSHLNCKNIAQEEMCVCLQPVPKQWLRMTQRGHNPWLWCSCQYWSSKIHFLQLDGPREQSKLMGLLRVNNIKSFLDISKSTKDLTSSLLSLVVTQNSGARSTIDSGLWEACGESFWS